MRTNTFSSATPRKAALDPRACRRCGYLHDPETPCAGWCEVCRGYHLPGFCAGPVKPLDAVREHDHFGLGTLPRRPVNPEGDQ